MIAQSLMKSFFIIPFSFVSELDRIKSLREKILIMKLYLTTCKNSMEEKLLLRLRHRQHFVENSDMFSLQVFRRPNFPPEVLEM